MSHSNPETKTDPRVERSRRALLDSAITLLLQNPGASLSDIAQAAGVGRATLYRHFSTREQLVRELAIESLEVTDAVLKPIRDAGLGTRETLERGLVAAVQVADRFHFLLLLWSLIKTDPEVERIYQRQLADAADLIERGKSEGLISGELATGWIVTLIDSLVYAGWWSVHEGEMTAEQAGRNAASVLFDGISATPKEA